MPEFVYRRSFPWVQQALDPAFPNVGPNFFLSTLLPTVEIFGTQRIEEQKFANVPGGVDQLEVFHTAVASDRVRLYSAVEVTHDDPVPRWMRIGQIIAVGGPAFNFVSFTDAQLRAGATSTQAGEGAIAARGLWVGPRNRVAARVNLLGLGQQMTLRVVWVDLVIGESVRFV